MVGGGAWVGGVGEGGVLGASRGRWRECLDEQGSSILCHCSCRRQSPIWRRRPLLDAGMVALLQKVLQIYACQQLGTPQAGGDKQRGGGDAAVDELLAADEALWTRLIRQRADEGSIRCGVCRVRGVVNGRGAGEHAAGTCRIPASCTPMLPPGRRLPPSQLWPPMLPPHP